MAALNPRNIHVLFVHGVGTHARLSSLLQAYQALRANTRSPEAPIEFEDRFREWKLRAFDDGAETPYLKLALSGTTSGETEAVYLYEVNYSTLAGVVRANQPLDITGLFVGFDLAVNVARVRLKKHPAKAPVPGAYDIDHNLLAGSVQKVAGVFVAATVPILGLPSLVFRNYTQSFVALFTRFFEDIATFALDTNGEKLISAHVDRTIENIIHSGHFKDADKDYSRDILVMGAHSLGTIVTHNYIVRHICEGGGNLPARVLTFGSPIGLICWLWLFLDFPEMDFAQDPFDESYFTWDALNQHTSPWPANSLQWINVVNHLDPIATAFPLDYVNLAQPHSENANFLVGGVIHHRFIKTGDSAASAHTAYFDDRTGFLEIVGRLAGLRAGPPEAALNPTTKDGTRDPAVRQSATHWQEVIDQLARIRICASAFGMVAVLLYLLIIAWACRSVLPMLFLLAFMWPPVTIGTLAFFQRFFCGKPTKRTSAASIEALPWTSWSTLPYRLRHCFRRKRSLEEEKADALASAPGLAWKLWMWLLSFTPSGIAMLLPLVVGYGFGDRAQARQFFDMHWKLAVPAMLALFMVYLVAYAVSEFVAHWRAAALTATARRATAGVLRP